MFPSLHRLVLSLALVGACDTTSALADGAGRADMETPDPCSGCGVGQVCVQFLDGSCQLRGTSCVTTNLDCPLSGGPPGACSAACKKTLCGDSMAYTCYGPPCGVESPKAYRCHGS